jgi:1-acyl-sn-glycerol-3-phosphate acyltransferase
VSDPASNRFDADRTAEAEPLPTAIRRRLTGRYAIDPFGLDPQLCDATVPIVETVMRLRVRVEGASHLPSSGGAVLVMNRGLGLLEPTALALAVRREVGRRLRIVGTPGVPVVGGLLRRLGSIDASPEDLGACLAAGHLVAVPLAPTWFRNGAGTPPLRLMQAMMGSTVLPVAVKPGGPFGAPFAPWRITVGEHIALDSSYPAGDPLGAAELAETARAAVDALLAGREPAHPTRGTAGLAAG